jgi:ADP-ribose pyrophosphatase
VNEKSPFEQLSTREVYRGRSFTLRADEVRLSNGNTKEMAIIDHPGCVVIVALDPANRVLLIRQHRYATGEIAVEVPAGKIETGENGQRAALRELEEETGLRAGRLTKLGEYFTSDGISNELAQIFLARDLIEGKLDLQEGEDIEPYWHPLKDAVQDVLAGKIRCGSTALALLVAAQKLA